jgi:hypothetical protein
MHFILKDNKNTFPCIQTMQGTKEPSAFKLLQGNLREAGEVPAEIMQQKDPTDVVTQPREQHMEAVVVYIKQLGNDNNWISITSTGLLHYSNQHTMINNGQFKT